MKKTKKKTTKKNVRTVTVSLGMKPPATRAPRTRAEKRAISETAKELDRLERAEINQRVRAAEEVTQRLRNAASAQNAAELELKATRQQNQKLEARLFLLGAANMYLADRLVKAAAMIENRLAGIIDGGKTARALDDVILFCKGMI